MEAALLVLDAAPVGESEPCPPCGEVTVYLTRRNLLTLLNKLDANKETPGVSRATLVKRDTRHPKYPQTHEQVVVRAVEDEEYYVDRIPGEVLHFPVKELPQPICEH